MKEWNGCSFSPIRICPIHSLSIPSHFNASLTSKGAKIPPLLFVPIHVIEEEIAYGKRRIWFHRLPFSHGTYDGVVHWGRRKGRKWVTDWSDKREEEYLTIYLYTQSIVGNACWVGSTTKGITDLQARATAESTGIIIDCRVWNKYFYGLSTMPDRIILHSRYMSCVTGSSGCPQILHSTTRRIWRRTSNKMDDWW